MNHLKMKAHLLQCLVLTAVCVAVHGRNYVVIAPTQFYFGKDIEIFVQMLNPVSYETVEAKLEDGANKTIATGSLTLNSGTQEGFIKMKAPDNPPDNWEFKVTVTGSGVVSFTNTTRIYGRVHYITTPEIGVFIQTDKAVYKTGQKVLYRVMALDRSFKPVNESLQITITDPKHTRIIDRRNVSDLLGISGELQLSEHPRLGFWTIQVKSEKPHGKWSERYSFEVTEYVLPKFEVLVSLPSNPTTDRPELKGHVTAKYTYGKSVKGMAVLTIKRHYDWDFFDPKAIQTRFQIDGEADFNIPIDALRRLDPHLEYDTLEVEANVTETLTGTTATGNQLIRFHKDEWNIEFFYGSPGCFKPGFKYITYLRVSHLDDRPMTSVGERVKIGLTYFTEKPTNLRSYYTPPSVATNVLLKFLAPFPDGKVIFQPDLLLPVPNTGIIKLTLDIPSEAATGRIDVEFKDKKLTKKLSRFRSQNGAYLSIDAKTAKFKVGEKAEFTFTSNVLPASKITYFILQENNIVATHFTRIGSPYRPHTIYEKITHEMAPSGSLIAYFIDKNGEIIADIIRFTVEVQFQNSVDLNFDQSQVEPGTNVSLTIKADPESRVSLLVVDKSAKLQGTGNDITQRKVSQTLGFHTSNEWVYQGNVIQTGLQSGDDSSDVFRYSSLRVLTDATINEFDLNSVKFGIMMRSGKMSMDINEMAGSHDHHHAVDARLPPKKVRQKFPETWIWTNLTVGESGVVEISDIVPDTITTWQATAFALNEETGLGITELPSNITVYMPFFVTIQLPFSVVSGEIAVIQAIVFNYYPYDMYVTVTLMNSSKDFVGTEIKYGRQEIEETGNMTRCILVKSNEASSAYFNIRPLRNGMMELEVHASSPRGSDAVRRPLVVKPKGEPKEKNIPVIISTKPGQQFVQEIPIEYPADVVAGSQRLRISVTGDMFGPSMDNLEALLVIPWGTGEQNMVRFAPAVYAANYLNATRKQDDDLQKEIEEILITGYQQQMKYQRYDGSFNMYGSYYLEGSFWLTAFVLKSFAQASDYIFIDNEVMQKATQTLIVNQNQDGSFNNTGFVRTKYMQGESASSKRSLTAYALIALKEVQDREVLGKLQENVTAAIQQATNYLNGEMTRMSTDYELAITAYALALMKSPSALNILSRLSLSTNIVSQADTNGDIRYWRHDDKAQAIETTSYALLAYLELQNVNSGLPLVKWLVQQRNPHGGFVSTQDTVVALQALARFASLTYSTDVSMTISTGATFKNLPPFVLNANNKDTVQFIDVPGLQSSVKITAAGLGTGLVEVASFYNVLMEQSKGDKLQLAVTTNSTTINQFVLEACIRSKTTERTGMTVLDVGVPSGYSPDHKAMPVFNTDYHYKEMSGERLIFYNDQVFTDPVCITVTVNKDGIIGHVQPASVKVYTLNNPNDIVMEWYLPETLKNKSLCDVCGVECGCKYDPNKVPENRCKTGSLIPNYPSNLRGTAASTWGRRTEVRDSSQPTAPIKRKWINHTQSSVGGQPTLPVGSSWSRRTTRRLGGMPSVPLGTSWRRETRIRAPPTIPVGTSWRKETRVRAQPSLPVGTSWSRQTRIKGIPTVPVASSWQKRTQTRQIGQPASPTWKTETKVVRQPVQPAASSWQSRQNVWSNPNVVSSRSRSVRFN